MKILIGVVKEFCFRVIMLISVLFPVLIKSVGSAIGSFALCLIDGKLEQAEEDKFKNLWASSAEKILKVVKAMPWVRS